MGEPFIAEVRIWACNFAPRNWAFCNGAQVAVSQNPALFSLIGAAYGGDGRVNFNLPNLEGRAPMGVGHGPGLTDRRYGQNGGSETVTLSTAQMPSHNHTVNAHVDDDADQPGGHYIADAIFNTSSNATMSAESLSLTGAGDPIDIMQPYLSLNFCIALDGIFPSQG